MAEGIYNLIYAILAWFGEGLGGNAGLAVVFIVWWVGIKRG